MLCRGRQEAGGLQREVLELCLLQPGWRHSSPACSGVFLGIGCQAQACSGMSPHLVVTRSLAGCEKLINIKRGLAGFQLGGMGWVCKVLLVSMGGMCGPLVQEWERTAAGLRVSEPGNVCFVEISPPCAGAEGDRVLRERGMELYTEHCSWQRAANTWRASLLAWVCCWLLWYHKCWSDSGTCVCCLVVAGQILFPFWIGSSTTVPEEPFTNGVLMKWDTSRGFLRFVSLRSPHKRH